MTAQARLLGGRYQVGELIGYGGMAEVHRGRDLRLGRDVAIKMLRADLARDATFQMRFRREAQNAASLNHPAIVAVYDTGEEQAPTGETLPFIVMEFVGGRTLKEVLGGEGRLQPRRALEICADMCAALEFSHRHSIIHRDIKPGNVMLTQTGQVKVMDFGIARALASGATTMTQTSAVIGTAQYLSPEQARGESVDARSDVYAAGCVLFELLCGHPPFVGDSPVSVAYQHVREAPPTPSDLNPEVPPAVDAIILKALSKNPLNRYQSAGEMRADLLRAAAGRPVMATPVLREEETTQLAPAGAGYPAAAPGPRTQQIPARVGGPRRRRTSSWLIAAFATLAVLAVVALAVNLLQPSEPEQATVPQVTGLEQADAFAAIERADLVPNRGEAVRDNDCTKGEVAKQDPIQGRRLDPKTVVTVFICAGPATVEIPNTLVGTNFDNAKLQLENLGFEVDSEYVDHKEAKGTVLEVTPDVGTQAAEGETVTLTVSNGNIGTVPNVVQSSVEDATRTLENAGYDVDVRDGQPVPSGEEGRVTNQNPRPGAPLKKGAKVTITVTVLEEPTEPPTPEPTETPGDGDGGGDGDGDGGGDGGGGGFPLPTTPPARLPTR
ncbi:Stk1 family PASTA domain-containing Ser/Thr kinase [Salinispora fenicalii]|uniref:Stk1 family PASTA domain-containing Ser/Thr kinase n=1 Tax=Salinispora fenicalii TaxID=1137263 RepID=UPI000488DA03|nr:Stk1 family PASTA domain-containing Ser/Thr kinase [Salinispora fenicalii]